MLLNMWYNSENGKRWYIFCLPSDICSYWLGDANSLHWVFGMKSPNFYYTSVRDTRIILNRAAVVIPPETPSGCLFLKYFRSRFSGIQSSIFHISLHPYVSARIITTGTLCIYIFISAHAYVWIVMRMNS